MNRFARIFDTEKTQVLATIEHTELEGWQTKLHSQLDSLSITVSTEDKTEEEAQRWLDSLTQERAEQFAKSFQYYDQPSTCMRTAQDAHTPDN